LKVAVYYRNSDVRIEERDVPDISDNELLVRVEASGICGSDVMEWYRIKKAPLVLGHEIAGVVEKAGKGVKRFKVGDRVSVAHHVPCNTCRYCLGGEYSVCDTLRTTNFDPGGFAEFLRVPAINVDRGVFHVPGNISHEDATFIEPIGCVLRGLRSARFKPGKTILVMGSGISGLLTIKLSIALGAGKVICTDINPFRLASAKRFGADLALDAQKDDVPKAVRDFLGRGVDIVAICAARQSVIQDALKCAGRGSVVLMFAPTEPGVTFPMPLFDLWRDNISIVNSYASPPADTALAIGLLEAGRIKVNDMITHRLPLKDSAIGFGLVAKGGESIKVIIEPQK
jgi:L-iditol 2-dehydrogenase